MVACSRGATRNAGMRDAGSAEGIIAGADDIAAGDDIPGEVDNGDVTGVGAGAGEAGCVLPAPAISIGIARFVAFIAPSEATFSHACAANEPCAPGKTCTGKPGRTTPNEPRRWTAKMALDEASVTCGNHKKCLNFKHLVIVPRVRSQPCEDRRSSLAGGAP